MLKNIYKPKNIKLGSLVHKYMDEESQTVLAR